MGRRFVPQQSGPIAERGCLRRAIVSRNVRHARLLTGINPERGDPMSRIPPDDLAPETDNDEQSDDQGFHWFQEYLQAPITLHELRLN